MDTLMQREAIGACVVDSCIKIHRELGPGLLEKVYEACLEHELKKAGFEVKRQVVLPISYDGIVFSEGLRMDMLIDNLVIIELKAVDQMNPYWEAQIISYLKLAKKKLGFLINFNVPLMKNGIRRFVN